MLIFWSLSILATDVSYRNNDFVLFWRAPNTNYMLFSSFAGNDSSDMD